MYGELYHKGVQVLTKEELIRKYAGKRVRLLAPIEDPYSPKAVGEIFHVSGVDDACQLLGSWESGGSINILVDKDSFELLD